MEPGGDSGEEMPAELVEFAHRMFDLARAGDGSLIAYVEAGLSANLAGPRGDSLLMLAAYHGHPGLVRQLLAQGADPDRANDRGQTPLAGAVFKGEREVASALIDAGADPDLGSPSARATAEMFAPDLATLLPSGPDR